MWPDPKESGTLRRAHVLNREYLPLPPLLLPLPQILDMPNDVRCAVYQRIERKSTHLRLPVPGYPKDPSLHRQSSIENRRGQVRSPVPCAKKMYILHPESGHREHRTDHRTMASGTRLPAAYPNLPDGNPIELCMKGTCVNTTNVFDNPTWK